MRYLELSKQGKVRTFKGDFEIELRERKEKRVSRIVPKNWFLRVFFLVLRRLFSDDGKIAEWTRRWRCKWVVVIDGMVVGEFENRRQAILFEKKLIVGGFSHDK